MRLAKIATAVILILLPMIEITGQQALHYNQQRILYKEIPKLYNEGYREFIIPKGRRWGFTQGCIKLSLKLLLDGISPGLWVDTVNTNINRYVSRYMRPAVKEIGIPDKYWNYRERDKLFTVFDSEMDLRSADRPENIEGFGYKFIILNEAGIILRKRYIWENAIEPMMIDYDPLVIAGGTPKGRGLFETLAAKGKEPLNKRFAYFRQTTYDNYLLKKDVINGIAEGMPEAVQEQEIYAKFLSEAASVFKIGNAKGGKPEDPQPGKHYFMGVDLAKHVDFTVIIIIDQFGNMVYFDRMNNIDWGVQKDLIIQVAKRYNVKMCIDATGVGDPIYDDLVKRHYNIVGYKFTNASKQALIESLMLAFENSELKIYNETLIDELELFTYKFTKSGLLKYSASDGYHDDCVYALALANWAKGKVQVIDWGRYGKYG